MNLESDITIVQEFENAQEAVVRLQTRVQQLRAQLESAEASLESARAVRKEVLECIVK